MSLDFLNNYLTIIIFLAVALILSLGFLVLNFAFSPKNPGFLAKMQNLIQENLSSILMQQPKKLLLLNNYLKNLKTYHLYIIFYAK